MGSVCCKKVINTSQELTERDIRWSQQHVKRKQLTPEIGNTVDAHHGSKSKCHGCVDDGSDPEKDSDIRDENLLALVWPENNRGWLEVVGEPGIGTLTGGIADKVHWPPKGLHKRVRIEG